MNRELTIYFAAPLFTHAERLWNADVARRLRDKGYRVILPQTFDEEMLSGAAPFDAHKIYEKAVKGLVECNVVLAILDGPDPDSGTAWECGYATRLGRPVICVRTDLRQGGEGAERPVNLMLAQSCIEFIHASPASSDCAALVDQIDFALRALKSVPSTRFP